MILEFNEFILEGMFHDFVKKVKAKNWVAASYDYEIVRDSSGHSHSYKKMRKFIEEEMTDEDRKNLFKQTDDFI